MTILDKILETKRLEIATAKKTRPFELLLAEAQTILRPMNSLSQALRNSPDGGIIAEFKRKSPSKGFFQAEARVEPIVGGYATNGAAAISVLTDREYFGGGLDDLRRARTVTDKPLLRKDFIIDPYQIAEARIAGADAILLIAAALSPERCAELAEFANSLNLEVLLELHDERELNYAGKHVNVVGVNNRNLATFVTDTAVSLRMARLLPAGVARISESGISAVETVTELRQAGFHGFLVGENFMKTADPAAALREFVKELSTPPKGV